MAQSLKNGNPKAKMPSFTMRYFLVCVDMSFNTFVIDELEHNFNPFTELFYGVDVGSR